MAKPNKTYYRKIKNLLEEYKEEKDNDAKVDEVDGRNRVLFIEDKEELRKLVAKESKFGSYFECIDLCKNFDSKKRVCNIYNCDPEKLEIEHELFADDYCTDFTVDKVKEAKVPKSPKKLRM